MNKESHSEENNVSEFNNDQIKVVVNKKPRCQVAMEIFVTPKATAAAYKHAIKSVNKGISIPGFRKGKAPDSMIIKNYEKYVDQEWKETLLKTAFEEAMTLTKVYPMNKEAIRKPQLKKTSLEDGATIEIAFETSPKVPEIDPKQLILKQVERKDVTESEIENSIENIRLHHAKWEEISDRPVQERDYIDVTIENLENPGQFLCKSTRFIVEEGKMGDWMRQLVIGKNVNDTVEGKSEKQQDHNPDQEFIPTRCKISIESIKTAELPELNEELAKTVGVSTVEELKNNTIANLNHQADNEVQEVLRNQLEKILLDKYTFDLPASIVQKEVQNRFHMIKTRMKKSGASDEEIAKSSTELEKTITEEISNSFCLFFIASKIAEDNQIAVTKEELTQEVLKLLYLKTSALETPSSPEDARNKAYLSLLTQKTNDHLIKHATIES